MNPHPEIVLPPHDADSEKAIISCILEAPACFSDVSATVTEESFYTVQCRGLYSAFVEMETKGTPIDAVTLCQHLGKERLERLGGHYAIAELAGHYGMPSNIDHYCSVVSDKYHARMMIQACAEAMDRLRGANGDIKEILDSCQSQILKIGQTVSAGNMPTIKELVHSVVQKLEEAFERKGAVGGLPTGFTDFDKMTDGMHPGEMIVIAGRPSTGKTSLAMNIVEHVALSLRIPVGVFSMEMAGEALVTRMLLCRAQINQSHARSGYFSDRDFPKIAAASSKIADSPIFIDDSTGLSLMQFRSRARRMQQANGIKLVVVDYLQLFDTDPREPNRAIALGQVSRGLKNTAKDLGIPVIALAQLNRDIERDKTRRPRLSDLRESGNIEADADLVGMLYVPPSQEDEDSDFIQTNLLIAKQRNGPTGDVNLIFRKAMTRFESAAKVSA